MLPGNAAVQLSQYAESCNSNASTRTECQLWYRASTTALEKPDRPIATQRLPEGETTFSYLDSATLKKVRPSSGKKVARVFSIWDGFLMLGGWLFGGRLLASG